MNSINLLDTDTDKYTEIFELKKIIDDLNQKLFIEREEYKFIYKKIKDYDFDNNPNFRSLNNSLNIKNNKLEKELYDLCEDNIKLKQELDEVYKENSKIKEELNEIYKDISNQHDKDNDDLYNVSKILHCIVM